jgi:TatD DNase family protein
VIDTHCHLDKADFAADRAEVLARAREAGVTDVVVPAIGPDGWEPLAASAAATPGLHFGLGVHPQLLPELDPAGDLGRLAALEAALRRGGAVAVGECGLDGPSVLAGAPLARQVEVLRGHLAVARRLGLPVILHCLKAHEALLALLAEEPLPAGGVLHSYSGSAEQVRLYARFDLHFSFAGPVTYETAKRPLAAVRAVARERLLLETDAPDQTPRPHRGRNEPALLPRIAAAVARALGTSLEDVDATTSANARALFRLPP